MFLITDNWIKLHSSDPRSGSGITKLQATALGASWPLDKGWKRSILDTYIPELRRRQFEAAHAARQILLRQKKAQYVAPRKMTQEEKDTLKYLRGFAHII